MDDNLIPVLAICLPFVFFTIWVLAATIESIYKAWLNARLKERLVERGASAQEIAMIVRAGTDEDEESEDCKETVPRPPRKSYMSVANG